MLRFNRSRGAYPYSLITGKETTGLAGDFSFCRVYVLCADQSQHRPAGFSEDFIIPSSLGIAASAWRKRYDQAR
jgi:hypothetical protein